MATSNKIAIVTGAGSGIGRASALALLREGYTVVLAGRRPDALAQTIVQAGADGAHALAVPTDFADPAAVHALFEKVLQDLLQNAERQHLRNEVLDQLRHFLGQMIEQRLRLLPCQHHR